jgi:hypothetical protein
MRGENKPGKGEKSWARFAVGHQWWNIGLQTEVFSPRGSTDTVAAIPSPQAFISNAMRGSVDAN